MNYMNSKLQINVLHPYVINEFNNQNISDEKILNELVKTVGHIYINEHLMKPRPLELGYIYIYTIEDEIYKDEYEIIKNDSVKWLKIGKSIDAKKRIKQQKGNEEIRFFCSSCFYYEQLVHKFLAACNNPRTIKKNNKKSIEWFYTTLNIAVKVIGAILRQYDPYYYAFNHYCINDKSKIQSFEPISYYYNKNNVYIQNYFAMILYLKKMILNNSNLCDFPQNLISDRTIDEVNKCVEDNLLPTIEEKFKYFKNNYINSKPINKEYRKELARWLTIFIKLIPEDLFNDDRKTIGDTFTLLNNNYIKVEQRRKIFNCIEKYGNKCNWNLCNETKIKEEKINYKPNEFILEKSDKLEGKYEEIYKELKKLNEEIIYQLNSSKLDKEKSMKLFDNLYNLMEKKKIDEEIIKEEIVKEEVKEVDDNNDNDDNEGD